MIFGRPAPLEKEARHRARRGYVGRHDHHAVRRAGL